MTYGWQKIGVYDEYTPIFCVMRADFDDTLYSAATG